MNNKVQFKVYGRYALFTDPLTKIGGEKYSYQVPTYEALRGVLESVFWKPTIEWYIDKVRIMKPIRTQAIAMKPVNYKSGGHSLSIYTYLADVEYQVAAHFEFNPYREDLAADRNANKYFAIATRMIERGGRRDIYLGTRECQAYVEPCRFGEGAGYYDSYGELGFGVMFHGFDYPETTGKEVFASRFWRARMINGVIDFLRPEACTLRKELRKVKFDRVRTVGSNEVELEKLSNPKAGDDR